MIESSYNAQAYQSHTLDIQMRTSSGDVINMNFENTNQSELSHKQNGNSQESSFSFSSLQKFDFKAETNGLDDQDKKEIEEFMKIAQPFIDNFMKELEEESQTTPMNKVANDINSLMNPLKSEDENKNNSAKSSLVNMFDNSLKLFENQDKLLKDSEKLLDKVLHNFDKMNETLEKFLYA
ncbi:MAG: hypothetical protein U9N42_01925 [Campylobacterota bacterium]|nr:hypothetical protein [Campylobacterota bacterium]